MLVFDEQEAGVLIAWAISSRNKVEDINEWVTKIYKRGKQCKEDWNVNAFMTDDASPEIEAIKFLSTLLYSYKSVISLFLVCKYIFSQFWN